MDTNSAYKNKSETVVYSSWKNLRKKSHSLKKAKEETLGKYLTTYVKYATVKII